MTIAGILLDALDRLLTSRVELTLYGRAAIALGFDAPPPEAAMSKDVDAVLWLGQAEELLATNFWESIDAVNRQFEEHGYFISHLFSEDQVVLGREWRGRRMPIDGPWRSLAVSRLADPDLLLSKLMRDDPADLQDANFIFRTSRLTPAAVVDLIASARCPDIAELREEFARASARFLKGIGADAPAAP